MSGACYAYRKSGRKANVTRIAASTDNYQQPIVISFGVGVAWINGRKCKNQRQRARQPNKWRANGRAETPGHSGEGTRGPRRPTRGSRPARTAPERGHILPPKAGRPTYGNAPPLRGLGIDRPGMKGVAIARERDAGGRMPCGRMPRQGRRSRRPPAPGGWRGMPQGLESVDICEGRR